MCMSIKDFMSPEQLEQYNSSNFTPQPSLGGTECKGNGKHEGIEIQCDECDHFLVCYPDERICPLTTYQTSCKTDCSECDCGGEHTNERL